jgi:hypothetical protein
MIPFLYYSWLKSWLIYSKMPVFKLLSWERVFNILGYENNVQLGEVK